MKSLSRLSYCLVVLVSFSVFNESCAYMEKEPRISPASTADKKNESEISSKAKKDTEEAKDVVEKGLNSFIDVTKKYGSKFSAQGIHGAKSVLSYSARKIAIDSLKKITNPKAWEKLKHMAEDAAIAYIGGGATGVIAYASTKGVELGIKGGKIVAKEVSQTAIKEGKERVDKS